MSLDEGDQDRNQLRCRRRRYDQSRLGDTCQSWISRSARVTWQMFNLAIGSRLRGCDLVALRVDDVAPHGYAKDRANARQRKTGRPVRFEPTEQTRESLDAYLRSSGRKPGSFYFRVGAAQIDL